MHELHAIDAIAVDDDVLPAEAWWSGGRVPRGYVVETGYVAIHDVVCHAHAPLYPAEVERAYRQRLELGEDQAWPPPTGYRRRDGRFVLTDGRNRYLASLMLGVEHLLVAWLVPPRVDAR